MYRIRKFPGQNIFSGVMETGTPDVMKILQKNGPKLNQGNDMFILQEKKKYNLMKMAGIYILRWNLFSGDFMTNGML